MNKSRPHRSQTAQTTAVVIRQNSSESAVRDNKSVNGSIRRGSEINQRSDSETECKLADCCRCCCCFSFGAFLYIFVLFVNLAASVGPYSVLCALYDLQKSMVAASGHWRKPLQTHTHRSGCTKMLLSTVRQRKQEDEPAVAGTWPRSDESPQVKMASSDTDFPLLFHQLSLPPSDSWAPAESTWPIHAERIRQTDRQTGSLWHYSGGSMQYWTDNVIELWLGKLRDRQCRPVHLMATARRLLLTLLLLMLLLLPVQWPGKKQICLKMVGMVRWGWQRMNTNDRRRSEEGRAKAGSPSCQNRNCTLILIAGAVGDKLRHWKLPLTGQ